MRRCANQSGPPPLEEQPNGALVVRAESSSLVQKHSGTVESTQPDEGSAQVPRIAAAGQMIGQSLECAVQIPWQELAMEVEQAVKAKRWSGCFDPFV